MASEEHETAGQHAEIRLMTRTLDAKLKDKLSYMELKQQPATDNLFSLMY